MKRTRTQKTDGRLGLATGQPLPRARRSSAHNEAENTAIRGTFCAWQKITSGAEDPARAPGDLAAGQISEELGANRITGKSQAHERDPGARTEIEPGRCMRRGKPSKSQTGPVLAVGKTENGR
jgi:hypothetical protein